MAPNVQKAMLFVCGRRIILTSRRVAVVKQEIRECTQKATLNNTSNSLSNQYLMEYLLSTHYKRKHEKSVGTLTTSLITSIGKDSRESFGNASAKSQNLCQNL